MSCSVYRQAEPANAGFRLLGTPALLRAQEAYRRLLRQIDADPIAAGSTAEENVRGYLAEIDGALAAREAVAA